MDKYQIVSIFTLVILCIWHAVIGGIMFIANHFSSANTHDKYVWIDRYMLFALMGHYCAIHVLFFVWLYRVPFGYRRQMKKRDIEYRETLRLQLRGNKLKQQHVVNPSSKMDGKVEVASSSTTMDENRTHVDNHNNQSLLAYL
jgi:hypothetical protein